MNIHLHGPYTPDQFDRLMTWLEQSERVKQDTERVKYDSIKYAIENIPTMLKGVAP